MKKCIKCGSHAFNLYAEEIDQGGFCDVHYWQGRAHRAEALAQPKQEPLTDEATAVIAAAKVAMDASFETENRELDISILAHLATALSLRLDEFEAAHGIGAKP